MRRTAWRTPTPVAALLAVLAAAGAAAGDFPELKRTGTLRVVAWADNLPELFAVKNVPAAAPGLEAEILTGFAALHGLKIQLVPVPTIEDRIPALLKEQGDVIAGGLVNTEKRRKQVDFTVEIFPIRHFAVTRKPRPVVSSLEQLRREKLGTIKGSSWAEEIVAAGVPPANVDDHYASADEVLTALRAGTVSATVISAVWALVAARRDPELQLGVMVGLPTSVGFAVRRDEPLLRAALDDYLGNARRSATWNRLVVKYFGESGLEILKKSAREP
jgi:ABC-type amino acid transport substrate-binding protein